MFWSDNKDSSYRETRPDFYQKGTLNITKPSHSGMVVLIKNTRDSVVKDLELT